MFFEFTVAYDIEICHVTIFLWFPHTFKWLISNDFNFWPTAHSKIMKGQ